MSFQAAGWGRHIKLAFLGLALAFTLPRGASMLCFQRSCAASVAQHQVLCHGGCLPPCSGSADAVAVPLLPPFHQLWLTLTSCIILHSLTTYFFPSTGSVLKLGGQPCIHACTLCTCMCACLIYAVYLLILCFFSLYIGFLTFQMDHQQSFWWRIVSEL